MDKCIKLYNALGFEELGNIIIDNVQNNTIQILCNRRDSPLIELIKANDETSSIYNFKPGLHHICYEIDDLFNYKKVFKTKKIGKIFTEPITSIAWNNRKVMFACLLDGSFIEFIEI